MGLPRKHEGLSSDPQQSHKKLDFAHVYNPSAGETETERSLRLAAQPVQTNQ